MNNLKGSEREMTLKRQQKPARLKTHSLTELWVMSPGQKCGSVFHWKSWSFNRSVNSSDKTCVLLGSNERTECSGLRRVRQTSATLGPEKPTLHTLRSTLQPQGTHSDSASERRTRQKSRARSEVGPRRLSGSPNPGCVRGRLRH